MGHGKQCSIDKGLCLFNLNKMLEKNWTPRLIKWLRLRDRPTLQVEALWALTNIAAGATDNTSVLLQNGVIPTLVSLLDSSNEEVCGCENCLMSPFF